MWELGLCITPLFGWHGGRCTPIHAFLNAPKIGTPLCQVVHVGSLRRVAVTTPRPPNISSPSAQRSVWESPVTNRRPALTLVTLPSHPRAIPVRAWSPVAHSISSRTISLPPRLPAGGTCRHWARPSGGVQYSPTAVAISTGRSTRLTLSGRTRTLAPPSCPSPVASGTR